MKQLICLLLPFLSLYSVYGQQEMYHGGNADGHTQGMLLQFTPSTDILMFSPFKGGNQDGYSPASESNFNGNAYITKFSPFAGGNGDGWSGQPQLIITALNGYTGCGDLSFTLSFQYNGTVNNGNVYSAELSNASGNFSNPVAIGSISSVQNSGLISCLLPAGTTAGSGYALRITGSNPAINGFARNIRITVKPDLGSDSTLYILCGNETKDISSLYTTAGLTVNWSIPNPLAAPAGNHSLIALNADGCRDTALVSVKQDVAVWTGSTSSDWHTAGNWNTGRVPGDSTHVIVTGSTPYPCLVNSANASAASVQVRNNAQLTVNPSFLLLILGTCGNLPAGP